MKQYPVYTLRVLSIQAEISSLSSEMGEIGKKCQILKKLKFWQNFSLLSNFTKNKLFPVEKGVVMTSFPVNLTQKSDFRSNPTQNQKFLKKNSHFYHMWKNFVILKKLTHVKTRAEIFLNKIINFLKISSPPIICLK